jgi:5-methylcytosine-specific restriction endonuclease McrA
MNTAKVIKRVLDHLYGVTQDPQQAKQIAANLQNVDFDTYWSNIEQSRQQQCVNCGGVYAGDFSDTKKDGFCPRCDNAYNMGELKKVQSQNRRAINGGNKGVLQFKEWMQTVSHFNNKCAYCQRAGYEVIEHFVPIKAGGDTAVFNCVPSCFKCNNLKKSRNPLKTKRLRIPADAIARVARYLREVALKSRQQN